MKQKNILKCKCINPITESYALFMLTTNPDAVFAVLGNSGFISLVDLTEEPEKIIASMASFLRTERASIKESSALKQELEAHFQPLIRPFLTTNRQKMEGFHKAILEVMKSINFPEYTLTFRFNSGEFNDFDETMIEKMSLELVQENQNFLKMSVGVSSKENLVHGEPVTSLHFGKTIQDLKVGDLLLIKPSPLDRLEELFCQEAGLMQGDTFQLFAAKVEKIDTVHQIANLVLRASETFSILCTDLNIHTKLTVLDPLNRVNLPHFSIFTLDELPPEKKVPLSPDKSIYIWALILSLAFFLLFFIILNLVSFENISK